MNARSHSAVKCCDVVVELTEPLDEASEGVPNPILGRKTGWWRVPTQEVRAPTTIEVAS